MSDLEAKLGDLTKLKVLPARPWGGLLIYAIYVWKTRYTPAKVLLPELA